MVIGSLFLLSNASAQSWHQYTMLGWLSNSHVSKKENELHTRAVFHALNNLGTGEVAEWYNDDRGSFGRAYVVLTFPANAGACRRVHSYMHINQNLYGYADTACLDRNNGTWSFVDKY
jgi:surface antigen